LEEENREMRALLLRGDGKQSTGLGNDGVKNLESYIKQLEQDSDSALLQQVSPFHFFI
jgi:hypothetical protein